MLRSLSLTSTSRATVVCVASVVSRAARRFAAPLLLILLLAGCASRQPDVSYKFVIFGDSQFHSRPTFEKLVREAEVLKPDLALHVGDMIIGYVYSPDSVRIQWNKFREQIAPLSAPFYPTPGNHDITFEEVVPVYAEVWGRRPFYYSFDHKNSHFIVLSAIEPKASESISDEQFEWLREDLEDHADAEAIFVSLHPPLYSNNPKDVESGKAYDWAPVHDLLKQYPVRAVFTGHSHVYDYEIRDGIQYFCLNSSGDMLYSNHLMGWSHHFLVATVTGTKADFAVVTADGDIYPPDAVTPAEHARGNKYLDPEQSLLIPNPAKAPVKTTVTVPVVNRADASRDYTVYWKTGDYRWSFEPWGENFTLGPGESKTLAFTVNGPQGEFARKDLPRLVSESPYTNLGGWKTTATNMWRLFTPPEIEARRGGDRIQLDGQLTEIDWQAAPAISRMETDTDGTPAPEKTIVKILYDDAGLTVGVIGEEPNPAGISAMAHGDLPLVFGDDDFELYFDPPRDLKTFYRLMANSKGTKFNSGPKGLFTVDYDVATHVGDRSWSAEFRIPYTSLNAAPPKPGAVWGFNARRYRMQADPAQRDWSKMRTFPPEPAYFGLLTFQ